MTSSLAIDIVLTIAGFAMHRNAASAAARFNCTPATSQTVGLLMAFIGLSGINSFVKTEITILYFF